MLYYKKESGTKETVVIIVFFYVLRAVNEFWVTIQRTEASDRCGLAGNYWLKAESDTLILKEPKTKRNMLVWPYKLLRRYGRDRVGVRNGH